MKTRTNEEKERTMLERGTFLQILFNPTKNQFKTTNDYEHYLVKNVNKLYSTQSYCPDSNDGVRTICNLQREPSIAMSTLFMPPS